MSYEIRVERIGETTLNINNQNVRLPEYGCKITRIGDDGVSPLETLHRGFHDRKMTGHEKSLVDRACAAAMELDAEKLEVVI